MTSSTLLQKLRDHDLPSVDLQVERLRRLKEDIVLDVSVQHKRKLEKMH